MTTSTRRTALALGVALLAVVLLAGGSLGLPRQTDESRVGAAAATRPAQTQVPPTPAAPAAPTVSAETDGEVRRVEVENARSRDADPQTVSVPSLGIESALEDLRTDAGGRLAAPREWQQAGWFADGVVPGDTGPAVIAGHVDSPTGPAVFAELGRLVPGDVIVVERADGTAARFSVDRSEVVGKDDFPTRAVYGPTPDAQLRLITCDGPYVGDAGGYQDNLVVYATLVDVETRR